MDTITPPPAAALDASSGRLQARLAAFQRNWRFGLVVAGSLRVFGWCALVFLVVGTLDYFSAFSESARHGARNAIFLAASCAGIHAIWRVLRYRTDDAARQADIAGRNQRESIAAAYDLSLEPAPESSLGRWLRTRTIDQALARIEEGYIEGTNPFPEQLRGFHFAFGIGMVWTIMAGVWPQPAVVIWKRIMHPAQDIPPYSPLHFVLSPSPAQLFYDGEIVISSEITGGRLEDEVRFLIRNPQTRAVDELPAFQESASRFTRKLDKLTSDVDVAFAVGRARSTWLPVRVIMQPKVQDVVITVEPPAYSGLKKREFALGSQELSALGGSRITATLKSNRPLSGGRMEMRPAITSQPGEEVAASIGPSHAATFTWTVRMSAQLSFVLRDLGVGTSEPLKVQQRLLVDERPTALLRQPSGDVYATPDAELPFEADATDDYGLRRVTMVRKLVGFKERSAEEPITIGERRHEFGAKLKMAPWRVVPGQVIEMSLEAADTNPNLLGTAVSESARIHIITSEAYAKILRSDLTLEEFTKRYEALEEAIEAAREALEKLDEAIQSGDPEKIEAAREKAAEAHQDAAKLFGQIARDFPILEMDKSLSKAAENVAKSLFENHEQLRDMKGASPKDMASALEQLQERLGKGEEEMQQEMEKGERASKAAAIMEKAGEFSELVERQKRIVRDMDRLSEQVRQGQTKAGEGMEALAAEQAEVAEQTRKWREELAEAIEALPEEEFAQLREGAEEFMQKFDAQSIPGFMDRAQAHAGAKASQPASEQAGEALRRLESLLQGENCMSKMASGSEDLPFPAPGDLEQTLEEMMQSLCKKRGSGPAEGDGEGENMDPGASPGKSSGSSKSGYSVRGKMRRLPIYGPDRMRPANRRGGGGDLGQGLGTGSGRGEMKESDLGSGQLNTTEAAGSVGKSQATDAVPEVYRDAVKRYFSPDPETSVKTRTP